MTRSHQFGIVRTSQGALPSTSRMRRYCFRQFTLNAARRTLFNGRDPVRLNPKTFDLLMLLIQKAGEVVTKDEVLTEIWNDSFVEEGNIAVHVSKLRTALGETKDLPFIQTVSGNGYTFVAPVREMEESEGDIDEEALRFNSIAVLPLANETGDKELDYLAEALSDGFINALSRIPDLRVVTRHMSFRYADHTDRLKEVGEELGVEAVVTGRVRSMNGTFSVGLELTQCSTSCQVWGDQFWGEADDLVQFQRSVVSQKTDAILAVLRPSEKMQDRASITHDLESHRMYLKGRYFFEKRSVQDVYKSILYYERSASYDPANVLSYVGMIESYRLLCGLDALSFNEARTFIEPVVDVVTGLDVSSDSVQTVLGGVRMYFEWDFARAEENLLNALASNPRNLDARCRYSDLLLVQRRFSEARKEINNILLLDPISPATFKRVGKAFYRMEQYPTAMHYLNEALEMNPDDYEALAVAAAVEIEQGDYKKALGKLKRSLELERNPDVASMLGYLHGKSGALKDAKSAIAAFIEEWEHSHPLKVARIFAAMGRNDEAFECLKDALVKRDVDLIGLNSDPRWSGIAGTLEFSSLLERIGLIQCTRSIAAK